VLMGAAVSQLATWRWVFYLMIPVDVIAMVGIQLFLHQELEKRTVRDRLVKLDWIGMVTLIGSLSSLLLGLTSGGGTYPWSSGRVIAPIVIGVVGVIGFGVIERYMAKIPMLPLEVFKDTGAKIACFNSFCLGVGISAIIYYLTIYFLAAVGRTLIIASVDLLPACLVPASGSILCGIVLSKAGNYRGPLFVGFAMGVAGMAGLTTFTPTTSSHTQEGMEALNAFAVGVVYPAISMAAQAPQPDELHSVAVNVVTFFRSLGQCFGVALGSAVFINQFDAGVSRFLASGQLDPSQVISGNDAEALATSISSLPLAISAIYRQIYSDAIQKIWYVVMTLNAISFLSLFFMRHNNLEHRLTSKQTFRNKNKESPVGE